MPQAARRPSGIVFASVAMLVLGGLHLLYGISEVVNHVWELDRGQGLAAHHLWIWGIVDLTMAVIVIVAAASLLGAGKFGQVVGLAWVALSAVRWLYWIPAAPVLSVAMLVLDTAIVLSLTGNPKLLGERSR
ncbi:MAG: hypothetical protein QOG09_961 [Solirubrobacterales bacterium]|jgi:hypothetical protein|nr:hypothetical protein [Solirubrobacterales bacterium]MDX6651980.1 hypothetical protein [Solirubrobacterales bacterium]MDX6662859.1 hypothetical protein [Solirubrobacterales bacterium]